jgi:hypothetical protein
MEFFFFFPFLFLGIGVFFFFGMYCFVLYIQSLKTEWKLLCDRRRYTSQQKKKKHEVLVQ